MMRYRLILTTLLLVLLCTVSVRAQFTCPPLPVDAVMMCGSTGGISPTVLLPQVGVAFSQSFTFVGASGSVTWSITAGTPTQNGLTLNVGSSASVTGTPTAGTDTWTLKATDSQGHIATLLLAAAAGTVSSVSVSPGAVNVSQTATQQFTASAIFSNSTGYSIPNSSVTWSLGTCAATGSTISSSGLFTPGSTAGSCTVQATWQTVQGTATATVLSVSSPISIQTSTLPNGQINQPYSEAAPFGQGVQLSANGGTPPYTWTQTSGTLPTGISLASSGLISGTPTTAGSGSSITFKATDSAANTASVTIPGGITVASISSLAVDLANSSIASGATTTVSYVGTYSDGSTAGLPYATTSPAPTGTVASTSSNGTNPTITVVQGPPSSINNSCSSGSSTCTVTITSTTAGTALIAFVNNLGGMQHLTSVTDGGDTFSTCAALGGSSCNGSDTAGSVGVDIMAVLSGAGGKTSLTCNLSATVASGWSCGVYELKVSSGSLIFGGSGSIDDSTSQTNQPGVGFPNLTGTANAIVQIAGAEYAITGVNGGYTINIDSHSCAEACLVNTGSGTAPTFTTGTSNGTVAVGAIVLSANSTSCATVNSATGQIQAATVSTNCTTTITGTYSGGSPTGTATLTVTASNPNTTLLIIPNPATVTVGNTQQFSCLGNVNSVQYNCNGTWASSNPTIASIVSSTGVATCNAAGTVSISGSYSAIGSTTPATLNCVSSGAGTVITAAGCSEAQVATALGSVASGAYVVSIPSGTCTWTTSLTYTLPSTTTSLVIEGASTVTFTGTAGTSTYAATATDNTNITDGVANNNPIFLITTGSSSSFVRVTGITWTCNEDGSSSYSKYNGCVAIQGSSQNVRLDHDHWITSTNQSLLQFNGVNAGVVDHSICDMGGNTSVANCVRDFSPVNDTIGYGDGGWYTASNWGSANAWFVEDNVFNGSASNDCSQAARMVMRYNTINDAYLGVQTHGTKQDAAAWRGCRTIEIYHNYFTGPSSSPAYQAISLKGGSALIWGNTVASGYQAFEYSTDRNGVTTDEVATPNGWGYCGTDEDGTGSNWDGNTSTATGYPCLDGVGRGYDAQALNGQYWPNRLNSSAGTIAWPQQYLEPAYAFDNTITASPFNEFVTADHSTTQNRDVYTDNASFNGTSGTGTGLLASRPSSCTPGPGGTYYTSPTGSYGVAYFATDANSGNGELYVCTATNTWTGIYQPYTYPHPLDQ